MADFDAGSIESTLTLDRTPWVQGMRQSARDADDFERRRITATADVDIRPARRSIDLLDGMLTALDRRTATARADIDTGGSSAALANLDTLLDRIDGRRITTSVDLDTLTAQANATALDTLLDRIDGRRLDVGIDLDTAAASTSLTALTTRLDALGANRPTINVDIDTAAATAQLTQITAAAQALSGLRPSITVDVDTAVGFLELDVVRLWVEGLDGRHVSITIDVDAGAAIARLAQVEALLAQISGLSPTITIDVDAGSASAQLAALDAAVRELAGRNPTVNVDVDSGAAMAKLAAVDMAADGVGSSANGASGGIGGMALALGGLVAVAASLLPALGAIAPALGGLAAIAGTAVLAFQGVGGALSAHKAMLEETTKAGGSNAASELSNATAIRNAQRSISDARRSAADATVQSAQRIADAERQVDSAREQATRSAESSARAVEAAERGLATAIGAEEDAQRGIISARQTAALQLRDLAAQAQGATLAQEGAALRVQEAELARQEAFAAGSKATDLERARADLSARQAVQALADQTTRTQDLAAAQAEASKGTAAEAIERTKVVVDAKAKEAQAAQGIVTAQRQVTEAQRSAAQAQQQSVARIADAERGLSQARADAAKSQERGAEQVARAVQSLADTQAQQAAAAQAQAAQGASAADKYAAALEKLSPAGRAMVEQLIAMKPLLTDLGQVAQTTMLPGITAVLGQIQAMGPAITTVVGAFGGVLGDFGKSFAGLMSTDRFQAQFKTIMDLSAGFTSQVLQSLIPLTDAFGAFGAASGPTVKALADGFSGLLASGLPQFFQALTPGIAGAGQVITGLFTVLNGLMPIIGQLATMLANTLGPVMTALAPVILQLAQAFVSALGPILAAVGPLLTELATAFGRIMVAAAPVLLQLGQLFGQLLTALMPLIPPITELAMVFVNALGPILAQLGPPLVLIIGTVVQLAGALISALVPVVNALLAALGPIIPIIVELITQLVNMLMAAIMPLMPQLSQLAVMLIEALGPPIMRVVQALVPVIMMLAQAFVDLLPVVLPIVTLLIERGMPMFMAVVDIFVALMPAIMALVPPLVDLVLALMPLIEFGLQCVVMFEMVKAALVTWVAIEIIIPLINGLVVAIVWLIDILADLAKGAMWVIDQIVGFFKYLYDVLLGHSIIPDIVNGIVGWFTSAWDNTKRIFGGIRDFIAGVFDWVAEKAATFGKTIQESLVATVEGIKTIWEGVSKVFGTPIKFVLDTIWNEGLLKAWNFVNDLWGGDDLKPVDTSDIPHFATGGRVSGPGTETSDSIPAWLSHNEFVQPASAVKHYGADFMEGLRTQSIPREAIGYATGGAVFRGGVKDGIPAFGWGGLVDVITDPIGSAKNAVKGAWNSAWEWGKDRVHDGIAYARGKMADGWDKTVGKWMGIAGDWAANNLAGSPMQAMVVRGVPQHIADGISSFIRGVDAQDKKENGGGAKAAAALQWAMAQGGKPYVWGATGPTSFDCSGLVQAAYRSVGINLGRTTYDQVKQGRHVELKDAVPGDAVLEQFSGPSPSHVGLYMGPGRLWNAPKPGDVVKESPIMNVVDVRRFSEGGVSGQPEAGDLSGWLSEALVATGSPANWLTPLITIAQHESGGNPAAENHWDSNEAAYGGTYGLMQTIKPTFEANKLPGMNDILNPVHNAAAAIRYIAGRYGSPWNTPGIRSMTAGGQYRGYAAGGLPVAGELAMVGERGPELVGFGSMARVLDSLSSGNVVAQVAEVLGAMAAMAQATSRVSLPQQSGTAAASGPEVIRVELGGAVTIRVGDQEFEGWIDERVVEVVRPAVEAARRSR